MSSRGLTRASRSVRVPEVGYAYTAMSVAFCFLSSTIFSALFLLLLMCLAMFTHWRSKMSSQQGPVVTSRTMLSRNERRLVGDLKYYIRMHGWDLVEHRLTTDDGFHLQLDHIIDRSESPEQRNKRYPVLMIHGLMQSAAAFCSSGDNSLALHLFRNGYDVWLGNNRGGFKPSHVRYSRYNPHMWKWGLKELGTRDVPCMIDFILESKGASKLALVAHSQGTTQVFYTLAQDLMPELGNKISSFTALAPAVFAGPLLSRWFLKFIHPMPIPVYRFFFGHFAFIGLMGTFRNIMPERLYTYFGYIMFNYLLGWDDRLWNNSYRSRQFLFSPVYVSADLMYWWLGKGGFATEGCIFDQSAPRWFDQQFPPLQLFVPGRDNLVSPLRLVNRLQNYEDLQHLEIVDLPGYSHLDVLWAADAVDTVGRPMADFIWSHVEDRANWIEPK